MATCNAQEILESGKCFGCLQTNQLLMVASSLLCQILKNYDPMASCDVNDLLEAGKCFDCLNEQQLLVVIAQLLCEIKTELETP